MVPTQNTTRRLSPEMPLDRRVTPDLFQGILILQSGPKFPFFLRNSTFIPDFCKAMLAD